MRKIKVGITPTAYAVVLGSWLFCTTVFSEPKDKGPAHDGPHIVMIIRHAEKPDGKGNPDLSPRGFERAKALATVMPARFPRADFIFASKRSEESDRPVETVAPLAQAVGEPIDSTYKHDEYQRLADLILHDAKYQGKAVLIAWHHGEIPRLAKALGVKNAPDKWPSDAFDRVWQITYDHGGAHLQDLPQQALAGDSRD